MNFYVYGYCLFQICSKNIIIFSRENRKNSLDDVLLMSMDEFLFFFGRGGVGGVLGERGEREIVFGYSLIILFIGGVALDKCGVLKLISE